MIRAAQSRRDIGATGLFFPEGHFRSSKNPHPPPTEHDARTGGRSAKTKRSHAKTPPEKGFGQRTDGTDGAQMRDVVQTARKRNASH